MVLKEKIHKATEGTKLKVEHTYFDEMRSIITAKVVKDVGDKDEPEPGNHN